MINVQYAHYNAWHAVMQIIAAHAKIIWYYLWGNVSLLAILIIMLLL
jgi:hypothetical protein